jgi:glutathione peroxidase
VRLHSAVFRPAIPLREVQGRRFVILGFPANNFASQESGTDAEIRTFCSRKYNATFPMFSKVSVKGDDMALYTYVTGKAANSATAGEIKRNFTNFLIG